MTDPVKDTCAPAREHYCAEMDRRLQRGTAATKGLQRHPDSRVVGYSSGLMGGYVTIAFCPWCGVDYSKHNTERAEEYGHV